MASKKLEDGKIVKKALFCKKEKDESKRKSKE
jgi:hypothetical protein